MSKYVLILIWALAVALIYPGLQLQRPVEVKGEIEYRYSWLAAVIAFAPLIWLTCNRGTIADTALYIRGFLNMPESFSDIPAYMQTVKKDEGFYFIAACIHVLIGNNYVVYLTIIACFQGLALMFLFRRYSPALGISFFLFIASTDYFSWMFNGIRQFTAVCIILFATPFMIRRKYIPAILIILLAASMHQSALIMIPVVIICSGEAWNKKTLLFIFFVLIAITYVGQFTSLMDDALQNTQYANVVSDYESWQDDGTNPFRVLVYSLPALISFLGRRKIRVSGDKLINLCTNLSIVSAGLYLISMVTSGIFIGRLPIYVSLYGYILLPWEIDHLFDVNTRTFTYGMMIAGYLLFYYYQMHIAWGRF